MGDVQENKSVIEEPVDSEKKEDAKKDIDVHSANDWEHADLGDQSRKDKFLKLMGATKADHKGKIIIGEHASKHESEDPEKLNQGLEEQFQHGLERKLKTGSKGHLGLGFMQDSLDAKDSSNEGTDLGTDTKGEEKTGEEDTASLVPDKESANGDAADGKKSEDPVADKRTSNTEGGEMAVPKKRPMMNFVKASDS